jgi:hypothetical protein
MSVIMVCVVLVLYSGSSMMEYVGHHKMSDCLKQKRELKRYGWKDSNNTRYACEKHKVEVGKDMNGKDYVIRVIEE